MTKNEYQKYMIELASRVHTDPFYSLEQYRKDLDEAEIEPWNLSRFTQLKDSTAKTINALFVEDDVDSDGHFMVRGRSYHEGSEMQALGCKYGDYTNGYSFYGYNNEEYLIYTYCEGDTTLTIYPDKESYDKGYADTYAWYKKEYGHENEEQHEPAQVPPKAILDRARAIMKRFIINGLCDEMYISNVIAHCNDLGDGASHFNGQTDITEPKETAKQIQGAYGCNIDKGELEELENIIRTGVLEKDVTLKGIANFIDRKKKEKQSCKDEWRKEYLTKEIAEAKEVLEKCKQSL